MKLYLSSVVFSLVTLAMIHVVVNLTGCAANKEDSVVEKKDTRRFVELRVLRTSVSSLSLIRDNATGREYLITLNGGIIEIPAQP